MAIPLDETYEGYKRRYQRTRPGSRRRLGALSWLALLYRDQALSDPALRGAMRRYLAGQM